MNKNRAASGIRNLTVSAVCLALCMVLPFLTGQIPQIGNALSPMHIPVLLCGFICGPYYAAVVGFISPLLRFMMFGMPPLMPTGVSMCFELAAYGAVSGMLYKKLPKTNVFIYVSLIAAMLLGRVVWACTRVVLIGVAGIPFTWQLFLTEAFIKAIPGIVIHIILIPFVVMVFKKTGLIIEKDLGGRRPPNNPQGTIAP